MKVRLIEAAGTEQRREIAVNEPDFLIGRGADCDLRLRQATVSRHHCILRIAADEATVLDLGSSNGTYLNGQRVRSQATLHSGDELQVGNCHFRVDLGDQAWIEAGKDAAPDAATLKQPDPPK